MKRIFTTLVFVILTITVFAQSPQKMSYQAVVRNSSNALVVNKQIGMEINIRQGSVSGAIVYTETQTPTTNANGLVSIEIGGGAGFSTVDWSAGPYFIETKTAVVAPLTTYTITSTSQLLSVPYALHAKTAEIITGTITETDPLYTSWSKDYNDLTNKPVLFDGNYNNLTNKPNLFSGNYNDLTNKPILFSGSFADLTNKPTTVAGYGITDAFDGNYNSLSNKPTLFSGSFADLSNKPTTIAGYGITDAFDGNYSNLTNKPTLFSGSYNDLINKPVSATTTTDGFMSSVDKTKLDGLTNADGSETKLTAGANVTVTGAGTTASPYVVNASGSGSHYLGEEYLGGIIFYLYIGGDGLQHGLVVSKTESTGTWSGSTLVGANRTEDGLYNTTLMPAGSTVKTWVIGLGASWYLPSVDELSLLWHNRYHINKTARSIGSDLLSSNGYYWSSMEYDATGAYGFDFFQGYSCYRGKTNTDRVRAIRAF